MGDKECLRCRIEADENMACTTIRGHGVDENRTVKDGSELEVHRRGRAEEQVCKNVNQLTTSGEFYFCKKPGNKRKECRPYASWKSSSVMRGESRDVRKFTCYNCNKDGHLSRDCRVPRKPRKNPELGNNLKSQVAAISLQLAELLTDQKKEEVF